MLVSTDPALHPDELPAASPDRMMRGVTRILRDAGLMQDFHVSEAILERGSDVHTACLYHDQADLDLRMLPAQIRPYLQAYRSFLSDSGFEVRLMEHLVVDSVYAVRGRLDRAGRFRSRDPRDTTEAVLEIKSGEPQPFTRLQLAAYGWMLDRTQVYRRFALQLRPDGRYKLTEYPMAEYMDDVHTFLACVRVIEFKRRFSL